ncbi:MAG: hypothetical protein JXB32_23355, partial [Deltaproteobacteria bacterium]|nr:hypothetical protein [Deltaproteobacteria bacterium]
GADDDCDTVCDEGFPCCAGTSGSCTTTCGSTGTRTCTSSCAWGTCMPPAETCNGIDDDCDTVADNGDLCGPLPHAATSTCVSAQCVPVCDAGWGNCDGVASNGCETSLCTTTNCGACGTGCSLAHATATCVTGTCAVSGCNAGWGDCNVTAADGCERSLTTLADCGGCGTACSPAHATGASCSTGSCTFTCDAGWGDCDGTASNGCEATLDTLANCGGCGVACNPAHATDASCSTGACAYGACETGWGDCDGVASNGCETSLRTTTDCGACGTGCSLAHATATCATGTCAVSSCNAGWGDCNATAADGCERSLTTLTDCGGCGMACSPAHATGASCSTGSCTFTCDAGWGDCDGIGGNGCETALDTLTNCGGCGTACSPAHATGATCATGTCLYAACDADWDDCDGVASNGCECLLEGFDTGGTCAAARSLGSLADNPPTRVTVTGTLPTSDDIDCFTFTATDDADTTGDEFHADVRFTSNPGTQFQFNVYRGGCSAEVCTSTVDAYDWYVDFAGTCVNPTGPAPCGENPCRSSNTYGYNLCSDSQAAYTLCVSRRSGYPATGDSYTIQASNGYY